MSYAEPINILDVDISKFELREPKEQKDEGVGKMFYVYHDNKKLRIYMPDMLAPFGAGPGRTSLTANKYSMGLSFEGMEKDTKLGRQLAKAHAKILEIDQAFSDMIFDNKEIFFKDTKGKKAPSDEMIRSRYKTFVFEKEERPDRIFPALQTPSEKEADKLKLVGEERNTFLKTFKTMGKEYPLLVDKKTDEALHVTTENVTEMIPNGTVVTPILEFAYFWDAKEKVNPVWTFIHGLRVSTSGGAMFDLRKTRINDDEEEVEDIAENAEGSPDEEDMHVEEEEEEEVAA